MPGIDLADIHEPEISMVSTNFPARLCSHLVALKLIWLERPLLMPYPSFLRGKLEPCR